MIVFALFPLFLLHDCLESALETKIDDARKKEKERKKKEKRKKNEILAKNADTTQKHITAVKHWSPPSFYCSALPDLSLVLFPEMSVG
jgi:hypothetical protein